MTSLLQGPGEHIIAAICDQGGGEGRDITVVNVIFFENNIVRNLKIFYKESNESKRIEKFI